MKKISDSYFQGQNGEPLRNDEGRLRRIAHRLGKSSGASIDKVNSAMDAAALQTFEDAQEKAVGLNKITLAIKKASAAIPNQGQTEPLWGTERIEEDGKTRTKQWVLKLLEPGIGKDDEIKR